MGLGKTIQVLALLLVLTGARRRRTRRPSLLVAPASLLANWAAEIERFAPGLEPLIAHPSAMPAGELEDARRPSSSQRLDLVITSYGSLLRLPGSRRPRGTWRSWTRPRRSRTRSAKQTRAAKKLDGAGADRAHRHAGREPARRPVVDLRLHQPGAARLGQGVHALRQAPRGQARTTPTARCATWCGRTSCGA